MTTEQKALLKIIQDIKEIKENIAYLVEAVELLVSIQTHNIKNEKTRK